MKKVAAIAITGASVFGSWGHCTPAKDTAPQVRACWEETTKTPDGWEPLCGPVSAYVKAVHDGWAFEDTLMSVSIEVSPGRWAAIAGKLPQEDDDGWDCVTMGNHVCGTK